MADISKIKLPSGNTYDIVDKKSGYKVVSINRKVDSGVNIADITIGDTTTQLYAPQGGSAGTITKVKTTAGAHTAIDVSSGAAEFNVPTKTSHLTNDSGFVTTDEKLQVSNISDNISYNFICMTSVGTIPRTSTALLTDELKIKKDTTTSVTNLLVGNEQRGQIKLGYRTGGNQYTTTLTTSHTNTSRTLTLPDATGTVALTSDITDEKVKTNSISNDTVYYPIVGSATSLATTKYYDASGLKYSYISSSQTAALMIGNETAISSNGKKGILRLGGSTQFKGVIDPGAPTADRTYTLPDKSGTVALTSDIPDVTGKIDTAGTGLSKSGTTLNHSNSVTAKTTQAVYPIKIDAQGHISAYGSAVTIPTTASDVGAVPTSRTVNGKALSSNISLTASDVSAVPTSDVTLSGEVSKIPKISSGGVLEVRKYIDMHDTSSTLDYDVRLSATTSGTAGTGTLGIAAEEMQISINTSSTLYTDIVALGWNSDVIIT